MIRVAFFAALPFHGPILASVRDALRDRADTLLSGNRRAIATFRPHVLVMAASAHLEYFRRHLPEAFIANVRHGMIGKTGIRRLPRHTSARRFDAVCVGDEIRKAHYERSGARPEVFWETGYPQLDPLFRRAPPPALPLDPAQPTVLYAPTWNLGLTSASMALALRDPGARCERRQAYARILFGRFTDGRNAERVAALILDAGARVMQGGRAPAAPPPRVTWLWHDLRTRLRQQVGVRRLAFGLLEGVRLNLRAWRRAAVPATGLHEPER